MNIVITNKIKPIDIFKMEVQEYSTNNNEVFINNERAPKIIEEALLFYLNAKGAIYIHNVLKEMYFQRRMYDKI